MEAIGRLALMTEGENIVAGTLRTEYTERGEWIARADFTPPPGSRFLSYPR